MVDFVHTYGIAVNTKAKIHQKNRTRTMKGLGLHLNERLATPNKTLTSAIANSQRHLVQSRGGFSTSKTMIMGRRRQSAQVVREGESDPMNKKSEFNTNLSTT